MYDFLASACSGSLMRFLPAVVVAGIVCMPAAVGTTQAPVPFPPQNPGAFRSSIELVPLDVRVLDRSGNPVIDLKQADFLVKEDGALQAIRHFSTHALIAEAPAPGAKPVSRSPTSLGLTPQSARTFLLVLGRGRLQVLDQSIDAAIAFVRGRLLPQDQVAVIAYNRSTNFTADHDQIVHVLERFRQMHSRIESTIEMAEAGPSWINYGSGKVPPELQASIDQIFQGPGSPGYRQLPGASDQLIPGDTRVGMPQEEEIVAAKDADTSTGGLTASFEEFIRTRGQTLQDITKINVGLDYLRFIEGEKHLVYVAEDGVFLPRLESEYSVAAVANDARVVIDTIQTGGLGRTPLPSSIYKPVGTIAAAPPADPPRAKPFANSTMRTIAELTGGQSVQTESSRTAFDRIDRSTRFEYLIGYYPPDPARTRPYRRIVVSVLNHPDYVVLCRHGYRAGDQVVPVDLQQFTTYRRIATAGGSASAVSDIKVKLTASLMKRNDGTAEVVVDATIDPARLAFTMVDGRHVGAVDVAIFCGDPREDVVGDAWQRIDLNLSDETYSRVQREGVNHTAHVPVKAQPRYVKIIVYDYAADLVGTAVVSLK